MIAAVYCVLTVALPFMTFGQLQCRIAEALTILPVLTPAAVPGLTVGCLLSNAIGLAMGANTAGAWDILIGTLATGLAAVLTRLLRNVRVKDMPVLATLPPVLLNAVFVGTEITFVCFSYSAPVLWGNILLVGAGELIAATGGGLIVYAALRRTLKRR